MSARLAKQLVRKYFPNSVTELLIAMKYRGSKMADADVYVNAVAGKKGLEVGGPSTLFKTGLPLYQVAGQLDGANFSNYTVWEGGLREGPSFHYYGNRLGNQFISDATDLAAIGSDEYEFVLSSNCLEHIANPLKALAEWRRVLKVGGSLILVLPNKISNFDHKRPVTAFEHLLDDYLNGMDEGDLTHLDEILQLHDLSMDPSAGTMADFTARSRDNLRNRTLHHHVFDRELMTAALAYTGFDVVHGSETPTDLFALATKKASA